MNASETGIPKGALSGLRVLDMSRILAGPWAGQMLGDLGAEVIKVENPATGDDTRQWGPPFVANPDAAGRRTAAYFTACNRNKRSIAVDFAQPQGAALLRGLARQSDIVIENYKVGGLAKYGLDYESLSAENPGLIYCSITGFGQTGPYAHRSGYDFLIQGMAGLMSITGHPDEAPGGGPVKVGVAVTDLFTGLYATVAILAALNHRRDTGQGQYIDCALFDAQTAMLANQASNWLVGGRRPGRMGNNHPNIVPYRVYAARDGYIIITVGNDGQFRRLCEALGISALAEDARYRTAPDRVGNRETADAAITEALAAFTRDEAIALLEKAGVPCGPINEIPEVFEEPNAVARDLVVGLPDGHGGRVKTVAFPPKLSATPAAYHRAPPELGADSDAVLSEVLRLSADEITALRKDGVVG